MRTRYFSFLCGVAFILAVLPARAAEVLITEVEAGLPAPADMGTATRGLTRGPMIAQITPDPNGAAPVKSPLPFAVKFQTRNNVPIDKNSVRLTYLRTPNVDLTGRVKKHIGEDGISILQAQVPPGNHVIRIELKDQQGRSSASTIKLSVAK